MRNNNSNQGADGNIPSQLTSYQDRVVLLRLVNSQFNSENKIQILAGLSGIGKTQLAYEWARSQRDGSYLIEAGSLEEYKKSINDLCDKLQIEGNSSIGDKVKKICTTLHEKR